MHEIRLNTSHRNTENPEQKLAFRMYQLDVNNEELKVASTPSHTRPPLVSASRTRNSLKACRTVGVAQGRGRLHPLNSPLSSASILPSTPAVSDLEATEYPFTLTFVIALRAMRTRAVPGWTRRSVESPSNRITLVPPKSTPRPPPPPPAPWIGSASRPLANTPA